MFRGDHQRREDKTSTLLALRVRPTYLREAEEPAQRNRMQLVPETEVRRDQFLNSDFDG